MRTGVILLALFIILAGAITGVNAKEIKLSVTQIKEKTISKFTVPIPVIGKFKVLIKLKTLTHGNLTLDVSVSKRTITPGEELSIYIKPISGKLKVVRTPIIEVIDPKGKVHKKELPSVTHVKDIPGEFDISIPLPIGAILKGIITAASLYAGTPVGALIPVPPIGMNVYGKVKTYPKLYISAMGCYPDLVIVTLYSRNPKVIKVKKLEGIGAKIVLDSWNLNSIIQVSSSIYGGKYAGNITPVTYKLVDKKVRVNKTIAILKTPIQIKLNKIGTTKVGEKTLISGYVTPPTSIPLKILCNNKVLASIRSSNSGRFNYIWVPKEPGKHFIKIVHEGSEFTTPAESNVVAVTVKAQPKPRKTIQRVRISPTPVTTPVSISTPKIVITKKKSPGFEVILALIAGVIGLSIRKRYLNK